jgi:membrane protease YdiL (CAAX protease family)
MMSPGRVLLVALLTQGGLIALAWWSARVLALPPSWGVPLRDVPVGLAAAIALAIVNYLMLTQAPSNWLVDGVRHVYRETIEPLFAGLHPVGVVLIAAAAGIGEEWLFRGIVLPFAGLAISSVIFGIAHVGGRHMVPFGVWATGMGVVMGALAMATGGLIAPMVAHGLYDWFALEFIRRGARQA